MNSLKKDLWNYFPLKIILDKKENVKTIFLTLTKSAISCLCSLLSFSWAAAILHRNPIINSLVLFSESENGEKLIYRRMKKKLNLII